MTEQETYNTVESIYKAIADRATDQISRSTDQISQAMERITASMQVIRCLNLLRQGRGSVDLLRAAMDDVPQE